MMMKKEYTYQLILFAIYYVTLLFSLDHNEVYFTGAPFSFLGLAIYHGVLFGIINYLIIPKFLNTNRIFLFIISIIGLLILFGIVEEAIVEKILFPESRGADRLRIAGIYFFLAEVLVPLSLFILIKVLLDNFETQKRIVSIEKDSLHNELKFLRSQIQPHVLFNSLNNLYEYTLSKSDKAPDLVLQLSKVLRYVLYETDSERIPLKKEIHFLQEYIALQETQLENRGQVNFTIEWNNPKDDLVIAPFVLIPFIENGFKHSLNSKEDGIEIEIQLKIVGKKLELFVSNTYEHYIKTEKDLTESGIGLTNVKKRLDLIYPKNHSLHISDNRSLYSVSLLIRLEL